MRRVRVLAGPTVHNLSEIDVNSNKGFTISSDVFEGQVAVFLKGFVDDKGSAEDVVYFKKRKRKTCSIQFHSSPKSLKLEKSMGNRTPRLAIPSTPIPGRSTRNLTRSRSTNDNP